MLNLQTLSRSHKTLQLSRNPNLESPESSLHESSSSKAGILPNPARMALSSKLLAFQFETFRSSGFRALEFHIPRNSKS